MLKKVAFSLIGLSFYSRIQYNHKKLRCVGEEVEGIPELAIPEERIVEIHPPNTPKEIRKQITTTAKEDPMYTSTFFT
jgi:hypothetical protein